MGILYPDNQNRGNRVYQLSTQIATFQFRFSDLLDAIGKKDERSLVVMDRLLKAAGFATREEYINAGLNSLTPEQRAEFQKMRDEVQKFDQDLENGMQIAGALLGMAALSGATSAVLKTLASLSMVRTSFATMAIGLVNILKGNIQLGLTMIQSAGKAVNTVLNGSGLSTKFVTAMKFLKNASKALTVISVILEGVLLIYEAIEGARQKTELQNAIVELCARRFDVMKIDLSIIAIDGFTDIASGVMQVQDFVNEMLEDGDLTPDEAKERMVKKIGTAVVNIQEEMEIVTDDKAWGALKVLDDQSGDAWRNEDPTLAQVLQWIEDHFDEEVTPDTIRWRIENSVSRQSRGIYVPKEEIFSRELKEGDKVSVSVFPAKL